MPWEDGWIYIAVSFWTTVETAVDKGSERGVRKKWIVYD